jgi:uncharacterized protein YecE (DUF72 family)
LLDVRPRASILVVGFSLQIRPGGRVRLSRERFFCQSILGDETSPRPTDPAPRKRLGIAFSVRCLDGLDEREQDVQGQYPRNRELSRHAGPRPGREATHAMKRTASAAQPRLLPMFAAEQERRSPAMVGTSGFSYADWKGLFYPPKLASRSWLNYYATRFDAVEINLTFYRSVTAATLSRWLDAVPGHFAFALKASQTITHRKRLVACEEDLDQMVQEFSPLGPRLACILFQLPPSMTVDEDRLDGFLTAAGAKLAGAQIRPRLAMEFRHPSWNVQNVFARLADHGWAVVIHDMEQSGGWRIHKTKVGTGTQWFTSEQLIDRFLPLLYLRFHGATGLYAGEYGAARLEPWAALAETAIEHGRPVHAYFNNTTAGAAVGDAARFGAMIRGPASAGTVGSR